MDSPLIGGDGGGPAPKAAIGRADLAVLALGGMGPGRIGSMWRWALIVITAANAAATVAKSSDGTAAMLFFLGQVFIVAILLQAPRAVAFSLQGSAASRTAWRATLPIFVACVCCVWLYNTLHYAHLNGRSDWAPDSLLVGAINALGVGPVVLPSAVFFSRLLARRREGLSHAAAFRGGLDAASGTVGYVDFAESVSREGVVWQRTLVLSSLASLAFEGMLLADADDLVSTERHAAIAICVVNLLPQLLIVAALLRFNSHAHELVRLIVRAQPFNMAARGQLAAEILNIDCMWRVYGALVDSGLVGSATVSAAALGAKLWLGA